MSDRSKALGWFHAQSSPVGEGPVLILYGSIVGLLTGGGALLFHYLIALLHNLFFLGVIRFEDNPQLPTPPSTWGPLVILVPVLGALLVTFLVQRLVPEAQGAGVSQVMESVHTQGGRMRPIVALLRPITTALTLGSGGSAGREGPAMQFGAAIGAFIAHWLPMSDNRRIHLVGCGVGAGIAAVFNAPLGGWFFAMEIIVPDWRPWTVLSTLVATVSATWITEIGLGNFHLLAHVKTLSLGGSLILPVFALLGIVVGLLSMLFIHSLSWTGVASARLIPNPYIRHMSAMFIVGIILYFCQRVFGHYYLIGGSYPAMSDLLTGHLHLIGLILLLLVLKGLATSLTIGTGGSGGIFSPSLFMGGAIGACLGWGADALLGWHGGVALFALCGMAGMVAGTTGALLSAPVMVVELTDNYHILLPAMVTALTAFAVRRVFLEQSVYTYPLALKGLDISENHYVFQENMHTKK